MPTQINKNELTLEDIKNILALIKETSIKAEFAMTVANLQIKLSRMANDLTPTAILETPVVEEETLDKSKE
jgi:hypothetical protein